MVPLCLTLFSMNVKVANPSSRKRMSMMKRMKTFLEELKTAGLLRWQVKNPKKRGRGTVFHLKEPKKGLNA